MNLKKSKDISDVVDKGVSNVEFVKGIMEYSQYGGLAQVFVIEALRNYCETVLADTQEWPKNSLISQQTWKGIAFEITLKANSKYSNQTSH